MKCFVVSFIFLLFSIQNTVFAALGESLASIEADSKQHAAKKSIMIRSVQKPGGEFQVHQYAVQAMAIREFVNAQGKVFAIAWQGNHSPRMEVLLGNYFQEYSNQLGSNPFRHGEGKRFIQTANLKVVRGGHVRALRGQMIATQLVPSGIDLNEIQ